MSKEVPETLEVLEEKNNQITMKLGDLAFTIAYAKAESLQISQELLRVRQSLMKLKHPKPEVVAPNAGDHMDTPTPAEVPAPDLAPAV